MKVAYILYYWEAPFRGNFIQLLLAEAGCKFKFADASQLYQRKGLQAQYPAMAPPYLYDVKSKKYFAQMPATMLYLGEKFDFLPKRIEKKYLAMKIIADCHDVLFEITNAYGRQMWTKEKWQEFRSKRFAKWLRIFEETAELNKLKKEKGFLLGAKISIADIAITALLGPILYTFPSLRTDIKIHAPKVLNLCQRIESRQSIKELLEQQRKLWGDVYCGGMIEKSLKKMIAI